MGWFDTWETELTMNVMLLPWYAAFWDPLNTGSIF